MTNKERWAGWVEVKVDAEISYLGRVVPFAEELRHTPNRWCSSSKEAAETSNQYYLMPCVQIIAKYPIMPGPNNMPVVMPIKTVTTVGMFETDQIPQTAWAIGVIQLSDVTEEQLQPYTDAYDQMLAQIEQNKQARQLHKAAITIPSADDMTRFAKGGTGAQRH